MAVHRLKFNPEAFRDIVEAPKYYENQKKGLGLRFRASVKGKLLLIRESPLIYALKYGDVRFALVDFFPYSIHFNVDQQESVIQVHAVLCRYRDPVKFWKGFED